MSDTTPDLLAEARTLLAAGISVVPINPATKQPHFGLLPNDPQTGKPTWNPFRQRRATEDELARWFDPRTSRRATESMAAVCGAISGGLVSIDFDVVRFYDAWVAAVGDLARGLPVQRTGGGRRQVFYRCPDPGPNRDLAWAEDDAENCGRSIAVQTRGEGGYACVPPSLHPSGNRYAWLSGSLLDVPVLPQAHADALLAAAIKLDECPHTKQVRRRLEAEARAAHQRRSRVSRNGSSDVIGEFNRRHPLESLLEAHGYAKGPGGRYCRPGREGIGSISLSDGRSVHFSSNDPLCDGAVGDGYGVHDAFDVFRLLDHGGDFKGAVRAAAGMMGLTRPAAGRKADEASHSSDLAPSSPAVTALDERQANQAAPVPLGDVVAPPLPQGVFTGWLGDMIAATAAMTETPPDAAAVFALGTLSCCVQGRWCVRPEPGYFEPLCSYSLLVMESGNRKTAVQGAMAGPLERWEQQRAAEAGQKVKRVESERKTIEARVKRMREDAAREKGDVRFLELGRQIAELEASMPEVPSVPRLFTEDVTAEHLGTMLADNGERLGVLSDEGGLFDLMAGRYSNGIPNIEIYLKGHSGSPVRVDRGTRTPVVLSHPVLTICCSPQPDVLRSLVKVKGFRGRGLLARFWYAIPSSRLGYRDLKQRPVPPAVAHTYEQQIRGLLASAGELDGEGKPLREVLGFSAGAWRVWKTLQREAERLMREGQKLAEVRDWASKFPGAVARIAGLLHLADHAADTTVPPEVGEGTMDRAVMLGWYLVDHALAAFDVMGADEGMDAAKRLWSVIESNRQERLTARDAWHPLRGRAGLRTVEQAEPGFRVLLDHNYIYEPPAQPQSRPGRPSRFFLVNPTIVAGWERGERFGHSGHGSAEVDEPNGEEAGGGFGHFGHDFEPVQELGGPQAPEGFGHFGHESERGEEPAGPERPEGFGHSGQDSLKKVYKESSSSAAKMTDSAADPPAFPPENNDQYDQNPSGDDPPHGPACGTVTGDPPRRGEQAGPADAGAACVEGHL